MPVGEASTTSTFHPFFSAQRAYMRNRSAANSAASSPPSAPWISTTTSRSSFGSLGSSRTFSCSSSSASRSDARRSSERRYSCMSGSFSCRSISRADSISWRARRYASYAVTMSRMVRCSRASSVNFSWSEATSGRAISCSISRYRRAIDSSRSIISSFPRRPAPPGNRHRASSSQRVEIFGGFPTRGACPPCESRSCCCSGGFLLTLAGAVEGGDRNLEHVVGGFARRELLRPQHRQECNANDRVVAVSSHEPDQLEARAGDHGDREDAAHHEPEQVGMKNRDHAEDDDADDEYDKQKSGAAPRVQGARAANRSHIERPS